MRKLRFLVVLPLIAGAVWWGVARGASSDGGPISRVLGGLRVVSAHAQTIPGSEGISAQQAKTILLGKLSTQEPTVDWSYYLNDARVDQISQMTQVYDAFTGRLIYSRSSPIDAWVVQIRENKVTVQGVLYSLITGFGVVSDNTSDPGCLNRATPACSPPGTILTSEAYLRPY